MHALLNAYRLSLLVCFALLPLGSGLAASADLQGIGRRAELEASMLRLLEFPYADIKESAKFDWKVGTYFTGVLDAYQATGNPRFHDAALAWSQDRKWKLNGTPLFADNLCLAQTYLGLYFLDRDPAKIADTRKKLEPYFTREKILRKEFYTKWPEEERAFIGRNVWWWCDALYMAPPVFAQMYAATGEQKYLDRLHSFYWDVIDYLYDREEQLVFRDLEYLNTRTPSGKKKFWSRGNGWVYGGLVRILEHLPARDPRRDDYLKLYRELTASILKYQGADGLWRTSLNDPAWFPDKETSGTAFFCYGLLAGINRGWLAREAHLTPALNAWRGLNTCLNDRGWIGHAQIEAERPGPAPADAYIDYTQGAYLLSAAELYKLNLHNEPAPARPVVNPDSSPQTPDGPAPATWARFVPERLDDFAWENDLVAFRTYGPAARAAKGRENSGVDCWLKRVPYPIIDAWYAGEKAGKSYHTDHGEGNDPYQVGRSRGCGGIALWQDNAMVLSGPYLAWKLISREPARSVFELQYEYPLAEGPIQETKRITIELGQRLMQIESRFTQNGRPVSREVAIGVTTHDGKAAVTLDPARGWMACWEVIEGQGLGTGVVIAPEKILKMFELKSPKADESHAVILTRTDADGRVRYRAGYGWQKAGAITSPALWHEYLATQTR